MARARARHGDDRRARHLRRAAARRACRSAGANIGIRIEDDVLVTRDGPEVLTADSPTHAEEIEALMAARA